MGFRSHDSPAENNGRRQLVGAALLLALLLAVALYQRDAARADLESERARATAFGVALSMLEARRKIEIAALAANATQSRKIAASVAEQKARIDANAQDGFESVVLGALDGVRQLRAPSD